MRDTCRENGLIMYSRCRLNKAFHYEYYDL